MSGLLCTRQPLPLASLCSPADPEPGETAGGCSGGRGPWDIVVCAEVSCPGGLQQPSTDPPDSHVLSLPISSRHPLCH